MRVTIIKDDNSVIVDGERHEVDCSKLPAGFHALQWYGVSGEVEHAAAVCEHCGVRSKKPNEVIRDLAPYQPYVDGWTAAKEKTEREKAEREKVAADAVAGPQG